MIFPFKYENISHLCLPVILGIGVVGDTAVVQAVEESGPRDSQLEH